MHEQFTVHALTVQGLNEAQAIAEAYDELLTKIEAWPMDPRCLAIVRTKLEEACFFTKKGYAIARSQA